MVSIHFKDATKEVSFWPAYSLREDISANKKQFLEEGFIHIKYFLCKSEILTIKEQLSEYSDTIDLLPREHVFFENKARPKETLIRLEQMHKHHEFFKALANSSSFNGLADVLLGLECEANNVQYFSKPPGAKATPPH